VLVTSDRLSATEAARRLGVTPEDVYGLIFAGELEGRPGDDGVVRVDRRSVDAYLEREAHV
jgi:excisionase family DNA binding protein